MVGSFLLFLYALIVPWVCGYLTVSILVRRESMSFAARVAYAYLCGMGLLSLTMLVLQIFKIKLSLLAVEIPMILFMFLGASFLAKRLRQERRSAGHERNSSLAENFQGKPFPIWIRLVQSIMLLYIVYVIFIVFWRAMNIPIFEFDPVQAIALKAKMFFYDRAISLGDYLYHRDRPLHIPLSMTWIALNLGRWDEQGVKIIFPLFFLAFCVIYFVFLKNRMNARWALVGLFLLLSSLYFIFHASSPYMDLPLMVYAMGAVFLILDWQEKREQGLLWLAGILAGIAAFTKREGAAFLIVFFFMLVKMVLEEKSSPGKKIRRVAPFFIPAFFFPALFGIFIRQTGVEVLSETAWKIGRDNFCSLPALIGRFLAELFFSGNWHLMWFVLIMSLLYFRGFRKTKTVEYLLMVLGLFLGFYFIVSFATTASPWVLKTDVVLSRLFLHFYPLVPAIIVLLHYSARNRPSDLQ